MTSVITDPRRQRLLLVAVAFGTFMDGLDGSIVNVALPKIAADLGTDTGTVSWVVISYFLVMAGSILIFAKVADRGPIRKVFLLGLAVFSIGSLACSISPDLPYLVVFRVVQGLGAAMVGATASMFCVKALPKSMLGLGLAVISTASSAGFTLGPVLGGFLTYYLSWHWIFIINVPIGIFAVLFAMKVLPADEGKVSAPFDFRGAVLLFFTMVLGVFALEEAPEYGIVDARVVTGAVLSLLMAAVFVAREMRCGDPLLDLRIFRRWRFTAVLSAFFILNMIYMGVLYLLPFYLNTGMGMDSAVTGLYLLVPALLTLVIGIPIGKWSDRIGYRGFSIIACVAITIVSVIFTVITPGMGTAPLLIALVCMGLTWGLAGGPAASRIIDNTPRGEQGAGSALLTVSIYLASVIGTALYAMVFTFSTMSGGHIIEYSDLDMATFMGGLHLAASMGVAFAVMSIICSATVKERPRKDVRP